MNAAEQRERGAKKRVASNRRKTKPLSRQNEIKRGGQSGTRGKNQAAFCNGTSHKKENPNANKFRQTPSVKYGKKRAERRADKKERIWKRR